MPNAAPVFLPIEQDHVILGDSFIATGHASKLSETTPTVIRAWLVEIKDLATTPGQDVTIIANQIVFSGANAAIDTSGKDAPTTYLPGNKPVAPPESGKGGVAGNPGGDGGNAGNVVIYASQISGPVRVRAHGGAGGRGMDGGDGSKGAAGPTIQGPNCSPASCPIAVGPPGQQGGQGGMAGAPGKAGHGGNLDIWVPSTHPPLNLVCDLGGGAAPQAAAPGNPGAGGPGGFIRRIAVSPAIKLGDMKRKARHTPRLGPQGPSPLGYPAPAQTVLPAAGANGLLNGQPQTQNAASHPLTDAELSANCSVKQLWSITQIAETEYLNDDLPSATPRLMWVASMAKLMGARS